MNRLTREDVERLRDEQAAVNLSEFRRERRRMLIGVAVVFALLALVIGFLVWQSSRAIHNAGGLRCVVLAVWEGSPPAGCPK